MIELIERLVASLTVLAVLGLVMVAVTKTGPAPDQQPSAHSANHN